jgi:3-methylfumaryl-CoA hydratase
VGGGVGKPGAASTYRYSCLEDFHHPICRTQDRKVRIADLLEVHHEIVQFGKRCIIEDQSLVYRDMPTGPMSLAPGEPAPIEDRWTRAFVPDPVSLFRFSALTYNGHRIHYDRDYATREEFYPGLVVHAPLLAPQLLERGP